MFKEWQKKFFAYQNLLEQKFSFWITFAYAIYWLFWTSIVGFLLLPDNWVTPLITFYLFVMLVILMDYLFYKVVETPILMVITVIYIIFFSPIIIIKKLIQKNN